MNAESVVRQKIVETVDAVAKDSGKQLVDHLSDETLLLQSGLDSLDFAIVVARLEHELGIDPFSSASKPLYPKTFSDLFAAYEHCEKQV